MKKQTRNKNVPKKSKATEKRRKQLKIKTRI